MSLMPMAIHPQRVVRGQSIRRLCLGVAIQVNFCWANHKWWRILAKITEMLFKAHGHVFLTEQMMIHPSMGIPRYFLLVRRVFPKASWIQTFRPTKRAWAPRSLATANRTGIRFLGSWICEVRRLSGYPTFRCFFILMALLYYLILYFGR